MINDIIVVDISQMYVYSSLRNGETEAELLNRAVEANNKDIEAWKNHIKNYPETEAFKEYLKTAEAKKFKVMTWDEYEQGEHNYYINRPLKEITADRFNEMLNILPPKCWTTINGVEMFCMSEMLTGTYTDQFARIGDKYYNKIVNLADRKTWIYNFIENQRRSK